MAERTWFRTVITMQPFCLQATTNAGGVSPSKTLGTEACPNGGLGGISEARVSLVAPLDGLFLTLHRGRRSAPGFPFCHRLKIAEVSSPAISAPLPLPQLPLCGPARPCSFDLDRPAEGQDARGAGNSWVASYRSTSSLVSICLITARSIVAEISFILLIV